MTMMMMTMMMMIVAVVEAVHEWLGRSESGDKWTRSVTIERMKKEKKKEFKKKNVGTPFIFPARPKKLTLTFYSFFLFFIFMMICLVLLTYTDSDLQTVTYTQ